MIHLGDITKIHGDQIEPVDCITFGSPCQDLSIAGRRAGLAGGRSGLFVEAVRIIKEMRKATNGMYPLSLFGKMYQERSVPTAERTSVSCWKNLPAWNSQTLLFLDLRGGGRWSKAGAIAGNGWSMAWRQLDAQHWGVPQRRKRIALVVDFAGGRAGEILFERESLPGHPDQSIPTWKEAARTAGNRPAGNDRVVAEGGRNAYTLKIRGGCAGGGKGALVQTEKTGTLSTLQDQTLFQPVPILNDQGGGKMDVSYDVVGTLRANAKGHDPIVFDALPFDTTQLTSPQNGSNPHWGDPCHPLAASAHTPSAVVKVFDARGNGDGQIVPTITGDHESRIIDYTAIAVDLYNGAVTGDTATSITCRSIASHSGPQVMESYGIGNGQAHASVTKEKSGTLDTMHDAQAVAIEHMEPPRAISWIVRRLTPTECERLQGYPDGWTDIGEWTDTKGKKHKAADSPRYKALGNSIALPQWFWIVQKMKPYMGDGAKLGSLFDGIGGFPLVWETTYGAGTAAWASEIEEFPIAVTKKWFGEKEVKS